MTRRSPRGERAIRHDCFAVCPPGLEPLVADELAALGIRTGRVVRGGLSFGATTRQLYAANLWTRCATRLVVRAGRFDATNLHDLERRVGRLDLSAWVAPRDEVRVRVSTRRSPLRHTGAIAERVLAGTGLLAARAEPAAETSAFTEVVVDTDPPDADLLPPPSLLLRISGDRCTLSIDTSGEPLHRRGWRLALAAAPLRPTLAAAALLTSGWDGSRPLADPFCGSGTICIEAALLAGRRPPGVNRAFAFHRWPSFEPGTWASVLGEADGRARQVAVSIAGSDRDEGAVANAAANARRAGVEDTVTFVAAAVSAWAPADPDEPPGVVVTNPPWGDRLGGGDLRNLYARLGAVVRANGWDATLVAADARLARHSGLRLRSTLQTDAGGQPVEVLTTCSPLDGGHDPAAPGTARG